VIIIERGKIDVRPVIGAVVVIMIIAAIIFGIYYFFIVRPAADELEQEKFLALDEITQALDEVGTDQAFEEASSYRAQVRNAGSKSKVNSILAEMYSTVQLEQKRKELLGEVDAATNGYYHTTADVPELAALSQSLKGDINNMTSRSQLEEYKSRIDSQTASTWWTFFSNSIGKMAENRIAMYRNSPVYGEYISKVDALAYVAGETWHTLRKLKFENPSTVEVPVLDTFQRTPTIKPDSTVGIYVYDITTEEMSPLWGNAPVRNVIYSQADIANIVWALVDGTTTQSYSVNMWETIKAAVAGNPDAAAILWDSYGVDVMDSARSANIGYYEVSVIYMVEVPDDIGAEIMQDELHMDTTKDVILLAIV